MLALAEDVAYQSDQLVDMLLQYDVAQVHFRGPRVVDVVLGYHDNPQDGVGENGDGWFEDVPM